MLLDELFGRECFLNEIVWAYDYGARPRRRWPAKHDTILVYVKDPDRYWFDAEAVDREPYMAPGLVTPEKAARGKLPTDVWWHTIVSPTGREKTGYPTQKPEGVLRRIVQASSRARATGASTPSPARARSARSCAQLGRRFVLVDSSPEAVEVARERLARFRGAGGRGTGDGRTQTADSGRQALDFGRSRDAPAALFARVRTVNVIGTSVVSLVIPAKAEYIALGRLALTGLLRPRAVEPEVLADVKLALTEACSNSIRHAYADGREGEVEIRYELADSTLAVEVPRRRRRLRPGAARRRAGRARRGRARASRSSAPSPTS